MSLKYTIGDLVWANFKAHSPWPGRVSVPPPNLESPGQTVKYCIYFFGFNEYRWVGETNMKPYEEYQEEMMQFCSTVGFMDALNQLVEYLENPEKFPELSNDSKIKEEVDSAMEFSDGSYKEDTKESNMDIDTSVVEQDMAEIVNRNTQVILERVPIYECEECAVCFLKRAEFNRHKLTHVAESDDEVNTEKKRQKNVNCNNNSNTCDSNGSEKQNRTITFTILSNEIKLQVENGRVKVPSMFNPKLSVDRLEICKCELCARCFVDPHEYQMHKMSHLNTEKSKVIKGKDSADKSYNYFDCDALFALRSTLDIHTVLHAPFKFICHCGIGYYRFTEYKGHKKLVHNETVKHREDTSNCQSDMDDEQKIESKSVSDAIKSEQKLKLIAPIKEETKIKLKATFQVKSNKRKAKKKSLKKLNNGNAREKEFLCSICKKVFKSKMNLKTHQVVHTKERPYPCTQCDKRFTQQGALSVHLKRHTGIKEFVCQYCPKAFYDNGARTLHERTHTGHKPYHCDCCGRDFSDPSAYQRHVRTHTGEKQYKCDICCKDYTTNRALQRHKIMIHRKSEEFNCDICFRRFGYASEVQQHVKVVHNNKEKQKHECHICGKKTVTRQTLNLHIQRIHVNRDKGKPYACDICTKQFREKYSLAQHMDNVHGTGKYICDYCGEVCRSKLKVKLHIDKKHSIEIFCHICSKRFTRTSDLALHKKQGCSKQVYKCDICDMEFSVTKTMNKHRRCVHFGFRLECHHCGAKYCNKQSLITHIQRKHKKELNNKSQNKI